MKKLLLITSLVALFTMSFLPSFGQQKYSRKELSRKNDTLTTKTMELNQKISSLEDQVGELKKDQNEAASNDDLWEVEKKANQIGNSVSDLYTDIADMKATIGLISQTTSSTSDQDSILNSQAEKIAELEQAIAGIGKRKSDSGIKTPVNTKASTEKVGKPAKNSTVKKGKDVKQKPGKKPEVKVNKKLSHEERLSALEKSQSSFSKTIEGHSWWLIGISIVIVVIIIWFYQKANEISSIQKGVEELLSRRTDT